jgi:hypothetical protein
VGEGLVGLRPVGVGDLRRTLDRAEAAGFEMETAVR